ncbi:1,4-alpha-glucan branching protein GlgB [Phaeovulum vinaykumarii]|uniref:1,4-alpha-glucan branching enzyme GlgB n=1 Tax=Phaeovulum vinaykumarii TaxID=407234 RepID=A0A1N7LN70_9RHOB|nr:1,4-alpha-glucan branching protein GlgB [Phaeovulum vinaykumarii]SIS75181.1 1,4-alpha-glucan branching enzyme [Phaeovulum vinaykumarii]SOC05592.1 1,4-alpha-glucan branching enzyme [Phaeovulum vinaykumarii]
MTEPAFLKIMQGTADDLFAHLGPRPMARTGRRSLTAFAPRARRLSAVIGGQSFPLTPVRGAPEIFVGELPREGAYALERTSAGGTTLTYRDPYAFGPVLGVMDSYLIGEGRLDRLWHKLGAHVIPHEGVRGTHFAVWAPHARRVSVVGDFNGWDGRCDVMRRCGASGVWEIFLPDLGEGTLYKYEILGADGTVLPLKADPVAFGSQHPPETASMVRDLSGYGWHDGDWMAARAPRNAVSAPISIYEVHLGSWWRDDTQGGRPISYREAARTLVDYVADMGFTHLELLPLAEHPFDGSWGYQPVGLFAPTIRHGPPHEFRDLIDAAHARGLGVLMDWVPAHFPTDAHGLGRFDGTPLYEYADPREGFHRDWNTLIYDFGRPEVANFLTSSARYWLEEYHVDGLRVDAVASMLYRDYSRDAGEWVPNKDGGRENYEAIALLRRINTEACGACPGVMTVAEESTAFPQVSRPVDAGGLGFSYKWNMGWMNDTLAYIRTDPIHRRHQHGQITFGLTYAFSENFILPISHDEVVHGKGSMLGKMPGNDWEKFANLRAYYGMMWGHPGKKLLFMGQEFGQRAEWDYDAQLDWDALARPDHAGLRRLVRDLNRLYRETPALHCRDADPGGFQWILADAAEESLFAWARHGAQTDAPVAVLCNFTPLPREGRLIGLPRAGLWHEVLNTDAEIYGGTGRGNMGRVEAAPHPHDGQPASARVTLPPLSVVMLKAAPHG